NNVVSMSTANIPSNDAQPGAPNNLFSADQKAWFDIQLYNNRNDPLFNAPSGQCDGDGRLIIRSTGHGPQGSLAIVEWEIQRVDYTAGWRGGPPPPPNQGFPAQAPPAFQVPAPSGWSSFLSPPLTPGVVLVGWHIVSL